MQWYLDQGVDESLLDTPHNRSLRVISDKAQDLESKTTTKSTQKASVLAKSELSAQAEALALGAQTLEEMKASIQGFEGNPLKKTATNMVFADGNPEAHIMVIGEAPGAEEDRSGLPFVGNSGHLLNRMLACIGLDRSQPDISRSVYITNLLNWRPPGNRQPTPLEIELSLPFLERHIQLVQPKILLLCGGVAAKALLGREESISKFRKMCHNYKPVTPALSSLQTNEIAAFVTYHPSYLLNTPSQKKAAWEDLLALNKHRKLLDLMPK